MVRSQRASAKVKKTASRKGAQTNKKTNRRTQKGGHSVIRSVVKSKTCKYLMGAVLLFLTWGTLILTQPGTIIVLYSPVVIASVVLFTMAILLWKIMAKSKVFIPSGFLTGLFIAVLFMVGANLIWGTVLKRVSFGYDFLLFDVYPFWSLFLLNIISFLFLFVTVKAYQKVEKITSFIAHGVVVVIFSVTLAGIVVRLFNDGIAPALKNALAFPGVYPLAFGGMGSFAALVLTALYRYILKLLDAYFDKDTKRFVFYLLIILFILGVIAYVGAFTPGLVVYLVIVNILAGFLMLFSNRLVKLSYLLMLLATVLIGIVSILLSTPTNYIRALQFYGADFVLNSLLVLKGWFRLNSLGTVHFGPTAYVIGTGIGSSHIFRSVLELASQVYTLYSPLIRIIIELGIILFSLLVIFWVTLLIKSFRVASHNIYPLVLLGLLPVIFYMTPLTWLVVSVILVPILVSILRKDGKILVINYDLPYKLTGNVRFVFGYILFWLVVIILNGWVGFLMKRSIYNDISSLNKYIERIESANDSNTLSSVLSDSSRLVETLHSKCNNCLLGYFVQNRVLLKGVQRYQEIAKDEKTGQFDGDALQGYFYNLQVSAGVLSNGVEYAPILKQIAQSYRLLGEVGNSSFYKEKAVRYYEKYWIYSLQNETVALEYARLLADIATKDNYKEYDAKFATVTKFLEGLAAEHLKQNNAALLLELVNLKGTYLLKTGRFEEAKTLYQNFLQLLGNLPFKDDVKEQLRKNVSSIIEQIEKLESQVDTGSSDERVSKNQKGD